MISTELFDTQNSDRVRPPGLWLYGAALLTTGYVTFAILFIGVKDLSRGGIVFAALSFAWVILGVLFNQCKFPRSLGFALIFYFYLCFSGFYLDTYPVEYTGQLTTAWIGSIALAVFVANGISIRFVITLFFLVFLANIAAIVVGYDARIVNVKVEDTFEEVSRYTGLIGQANKFIATIAVLPFLHFLLRSSISKAYYFNLLLILATGTILTGSRTGVVFFSFFAIFGALFLIKGIYLKILVAFISLIAAIVTISYFDKEKFIYFLETSDFGELTIVERSIAGIEGDDGSAALRSDLKNAFWPFFWERPILGYGPNQFKEIGVAGFEGYAHNNIGEIAINWGLIGLILYYAIITAICIRLITGPPYKFHMLALPAVLLLADNWFVTFLSRPLVLLLCLTLVLSFPSVMKRARSKPKSRPEYL